jgi:hypothetical protein
LGRRGVRAGGKMSIHQRTFATLSFWFVSQNRGPTA